MGRKIADFLNGFFVVVVLFFISVSITGEIRGHGGFIGEIESWSNSQQEEQLPDNDTGENLEITDNAIVVK